MTPKERAAMQQALEALGRIHFAATELDRRNRIRWFDDAVDETKEAITALREALAEQAKQEPVAWKQTVRALTDQCATLIQERDELQKKVWQYEKHGVTCQLYGHKIERSCAECNQDETYAALVAAHEREACAKVCDDELNDDWDTPAKSAIANCAAAIRARSGK